MKPDGTPVPAPLTQEQMQESFEPLQFAGSSIVLPDGNYRVYTTAEDYVEVNASSAHEAMQMTDIRTPFKIERRSLNRIAVLTQEILDDAAEVEAQLNGTHEQPAQADAQPAPEAAAAAAPTEFPDEQIAQERGLDDNEVDALLGDMPDDES